MIEMFTLSESTYALLMVGQLAATGYMTGLVWFVQWVHYPLLDAVGRDGFRDYEREHVRRTSPVVGPVMAFELGCALLLLLSPHPAIPAWAPAVGAALVAVLWISTWTLQIPRHTRLSEGFDAAAQRSLVSTNWIRTVAWSLRLLLVSWMLLRLH